MAFAWAKLGATDTAAVLAFTVLWPVLRAVVNRSVLLPLACRLVRTRRRSSQPATELRVRAERFSESAWKLLSYGFFCCWALHVLLTEGWAANSAAWWAGWPDRQRHSAALRGLYAAELGHYIAGVWMLAAGIETRRKDHTIMMTHHLATIALIGLSLALGFLRVGAVIMALHDVNDVFLEAAKLCRYCEREGAASALLVAFMLSWLATRLTYFPLVVIRSVLFQGPAVMGRPPPFHMLFAGLLVLLLLMHVYWFSLILKIAVRKVVSGTVDDTREDEGLSDND